ncbi:pseudouridine synthase-like protein TruD/Pus7 [Phyllosticta citriasiana]|uniref:pseudouridine synthase-like protein TruD/Pus7 n=1 Tax=Phyllosticta citriasiana TaxID=595635 RepID=UPI0030FD36C6
MADHDLDPSDRPAKRQRVEGEVTMTDADADATTNPGAQCLSQTLELVADGTARKDLEDQLAKEIRVGVDQFTSPETSGFIGVFKQRYHDFMVNEIAIDGTVWHLEQDAGFEAAEKKAQIEAAAEEKEKEKEKESQAKEEVKEPAKPAEEPAGEPEEQPKADSSAEIAEPQVNRLKAIFGDEVADAIVALDREVVHKPNRKAREFGTVSSKPIDRADRSAAHQAVREIFNHRLATETEEGGIIKVVAGNPKVRRGHAPPPNSKGSSVGRRNNNKQNPVFKVNWNEVGGEHLHFTLYKENKDTMEIISFLCKSLRVDDRKFGYAGTKDRRAVTVQRISATRISAPQMADLASRLFNCRIGNFAYKPKPLSLGDLAGNEFTITLRDCHFSGEEDKSIEQRVENARVRLQKAVQHFESHGFINYFGLQRFGTYAVSTDTIGKHMLKGDLETAVDLIMSYSQEAVEAYDKAEDSLISDDDKKRAKALHIWKTEGNANRALEILPSRFTAEKRFISWLGQKDHRTKQFKHANDYQGAMIQLPRNLRLIYPHAYQSLVWNTVASERIKRHGLKVIPGDLVLVHEHKDKEVNNANAEPEALEEFDADGELIIRPEGDNAAADPFERARALTQEEVESGRYTIFDLVLPTPGYDVEYPANDIGRFYEEFMKDEQRGGGIDPHDMRRKWRDISLSGGYRKLLARALGGGVGFDVKTYRDGGSGSSEQQLVPTDLDRLIEQGKGISLEEARKRNWVGHPNKNAKDAAASSLPKSAVSEQPQTQEKLAVVLKFKLGSSTYATVALRELMKGGAQAFKPEFSR